MEEVVDALIEASHRLDRKRAIAQERRLADALVQVVEFAERLGRWVRTDVVPASALRHVVYLAEKLRDACQDIEAWARCEEKALADLRGPAEALPPNDVESSVRFNTPYERPSGNDPILESAPRLAVERENASPRGGQALHARAERRFDLASFLYGSASLAVGVVLCLAIVLLRQPLRQEKSWKGEWKRNLKPFEAIQRVRPPPGTRGFALLIAASSRIDRVGDRDGLRRTVPCHVAW